MRGDGFIPMGTDAQTTLLRWAAEQPGSTGLALLGAGLLYGLIGFRFVRLLVVVSSTVVGAALAHLMIDKYAEGGRTLVVLAGVVAGWLAIVKPRTALVMCSGATWAAMLYHLANALAAPHQIAVVAILVAATVAMILTMLCRETMTLLFLTMNGTAAAMLGFIGLAQDLAPTLGYTFRDLAARHPLFVPIFMAILGCTAYTIQANAQRGDLIRGKPRFVLV